MQAYLELCQLREENNDSLCWEPRSLQDYLGAIPHIPRPTAQPPPPEHPFAVLPWTAGGAPGTKSV